VGRHNTAGKRVAVGVYYYRITAQSGEHALVKLLLQSKHSTQFVFMAGLCMGMWYPCNAQIGGLPGAYLRSPVGAAAFSMGGAQSASPDVLSAWNNPSYDGYTADNTVDFWRRLTFPRTQRSVFGCRVQGFAPSFHGICRAIPGDASINDIHNANEEIIGSGSFTTMSLESGGLAILYRVR